MTDLGGALLRFVREELLRGRDIAVDRETYLFADGLVDSLGILKLIAFLEVKIGRSIPDQDVVMEHFRSVAAIERRFGGAGASHGR